MIRWLRRELERCLMDRAFRTLHERIDEAEGKYERSKANVLKLSQSVNSMADHIRSLEEKEVVIRLRKAEEQRDMLTGHLQIAKAKRLKIIENGKLQNEITRRLRDIVGDEQFLSICEELEAKAKTEEVSP